MTCAHCEQPIRRLVRVRRYCTTRCRHQAAYLRKLEARARALTQRRITA